VTDNTVGGTELAHEFLGYAAARGSGHSEALLCRP
jgi:hypothetical protein